MHDLFIIHRNSKSLKCDFNTMVVRNAAIVEKYHCGIKTFAERYNPRFNNNLAVMCYMFEVDIDPLV